MPADGTTAGARHPAVGRRAVGAPTREFALAPVLFGRSPRGSSARAALVYPGNGTMPYPFSVGRIRVTPLVFDLSGDLEAGGRAFLGQLMMMLGA